MLLGCIADDFTGATDLANNLVRSGMRTVQTIGVPADGQAPQADAVVVALKSRTTPASEAVADSLAALDWLRRLGCRQFYFKYCSTFDSTDAGNIGPVTEALMRALNTDFTIACPAFPATGRTVYRGHLFVGDALLSESGMQNHPLTPMTDANLVRVLGRQMSAPVGLIAYDRLAAGVQATRQRIAELRAQGVGAAIADSLRDADLEVLGAACADLPLVTAGSGLAIGLPQNFRALGLLPEGQQAGRLPAVHGPAVVLSGSCSTATLAQVASFAKQHPAMQLDPLELAANAEPSVRRAIDFARQAQARGEVPMIYASAAPEAVRAAQARLGQARAGEAVEAAVAACARALREHGTRRFVVAGGETSGAVVKALGVQALRIGPQIDPGVPWTESLGDSALAIALKSGNFGAPDFFAKALAMLDGAQA
ncbi:MAG: four-carbon acid sugar kinase family protein [Burkholderiaceae bacterium]